MVPDLIYDVGVHDGSDTEYYLYRGFRVLGIEAHPENAARARERFSNEIKAGKFTLEEVAISDHTGHATFWTNTAMDDNSSLYRSVAKEGNKYRHGGQIVSFNVQTVTFDLILKKYGVPYYLKCDIERGDIFCLQVLKKEDLPIYISCEAHNLDCLIKLYDLGYREFKTIDQELNYQTSKNQTAWYFGGYSSGPFGEDTIGDWEDVNTTAYKWLHRYFGFEKRGPLTNKSWYDWHARLDFKEGENKPSFYRS